MSVVVASPDAMHALAGKEIGSSPWVEVTQESIDGFAQLTGDDQWLHTDTERAAAGPFGTTIAHGFLTLSLLIPLLEQILILENRSSSINYGLDKVRFPAAVPSGSRVRLTATLAEVADLDTGVQVKVDCVFEVEGQQRPACVARAVLRHHFAP